MTETSRLADHERFMIDRARVRGAARRASSNPIDKLDGQLLDGLADLAERLADGAAEAAEAEPPSV